MTISVTRNETIVTNKSDHFEGSDNDISENDFEVFHENNSLIAGANNRDMTFFQGRNSITISRPDREAVMNYFNASSRNAETETTYKGVTYRIVPSLKQSNSGDLIEVRVSQVQPTKARGFDGLSDPSLFLNPYHETKVEGKFFMQNSNGVLQLTQ
jgi:hypothetical protein